MASVPDADLEHILAHTDTLWQELAGARLFITGGTGFFGIWLLEAIAAANDRLRVGVGATVLSRDPAAFLARMPHLANRRQLEWLAGHPTSFAFPSRCHDYILHLATATSAHLGKTDPHQMLETKMASIRRVLDYARHCGAKRLLVTSSGAIYGPQPADVSHVPETYRGAPDPTDPASAYGQGKRLVEQMCAVTPGIDCVVARCFSFIGPHLPLDARFAAGNFVRDALAGGPLVIRGDGRAVRSYMHAADLTIWLLTLLLHGAKSTAYNVGSDQPITMRDLAALVAALPPRPVEIVLRGDAPLSMPPNVYLPDIQKARSELGLEVLLPLPEALRRTLLWAHGTIELPI